MAAEGALVAPMRAGEGIRQWRGAVVAAVMLGCVAAVALLAGWSNAQPMRRGGSALAPLSAEEADKHLFRNNQPMQDYPEWTKSIDDINAAGRVNHGVWEPFKGPPFMQRMALFSGNDVDVTKAGNLIRMVMGLKKNFGKWEGNGFIKSFEGQQMRFVQSNKNSVLVIPPLSEGNLPVLTDYAKGMLHHYISAGSNSIVVTGGPASVDFINQNFLTNDGSQLLEPAWTRGPYERQVPLCVRERERERCRCLNICLYIYIYMNE